MKRAVVLGTSGAGKSTFSAELARRMKCCHIDRDQLWGDDVPMESEEFRSAVDETTSKGCWVFDGMPFYVEDVVFSRADTLVCLDYSKPVVMNRVLRRSVRQTFLQQQVGVHSPLSLRSLRRADHPMRWAWTTHRERRDQMHEWANRPELSHTEKVFLRSPREAKRWLASVSS